MIAGPTTRTPTLSAWLLPLAVLAIVAACVVDIPMYDEWIWSPLVLAQHAGTLHLADVWAPQGAHRSVVPTLLALGLARLDGWNVRVEALLSVSFVALAQASLLAIVRRRLGTSARAASAFLLASLLLYSFVQAENWLWGFQLSWFIVQACALGVVWALDGRPSGARFALAVACALIASFSLLFGFATWVAGAVLLLRDRVRLALWLLLGAIAAVVFLHGYHLPRFENGWIGGAAAPFVDGPQFLLAYLGAPLGLAGGRWTCELLGLALLIACGTLGVRAARAGTTPAPWLALLAFALVAAVLETAGRAGNTVEAALAFRYTTPATLGWIALVGLAAQVPATRAAPHRAAYALAGVLFVVANAAGAFEALQLAGMQRAAAAALADPAAVDDDELAQYENDPAFLRAQAAALRAARLGPYAPGAPDAVSATGRTARGRSASPPSCAPRSGTSAYSAGARTVARTGSGTHR
ncbi:MAG TPA: hypothetical protein VMD91_13975 [Candidatus Sulfotelmatobacter sp.]|nr:hypothetical protein [Candidatus Sulfotelmatobacter sp.]